MVNRKLAILLIFMTFGLILGVPALASPTETYTLAYDDMTRHYELFVPSTYDASQPTPVIVALHGIYSNAKTFRILSGLDAAAEATGFIVVYPDSLYGFWDDGRVDEGMYPFEGNVNDSGFIMALLDALGDEYTLDEERIYLTGTNNGGGLVLAMACAQPEDFAAFATVGSGLWNYHTENCPPEPEGGLNLLMVLGDNDDVYRVPGRDFGTESSVTGKTLNILGIEDAARFWLERYACSEDETLLVDAARIIEFADCETPTRITVKMVQGAGNNWMRRGDDYILNQSGVDASEIVTRYFAGDENWIEAATPTQPAEGLPRTYIVNLPSSYDPAKPLPIVFLLHGRPSSANGMAFTTEMHKIGEREGFITVYPNGLNNEWNYGNKLPGYKVETQRDDVQFMRDLIHDLSLDLAIDQERIYVTGFSNGGFMTERLACEAPDHFSAFAVVGATGFALMENICSVTPTPILFMHGTEDISIPWEGDKREVEGGTIALLNSVAETFAIWSVHNGCNIENTVSTDIPKLDETAPTEVKVFKLDDCPSGKSVWLYTIALGGHNWAGVKNIGVVGPEFAGNINMDINAGEVIWEFFEGYTRDVNP